MKREDMKIGGKYVRIRNSTQGPDSFLTVKIGQIVTCKETRLTGFIAEEALTCILMTIDFEPYEEPRMVTTCDIGIMKREDMVIGKQYIRVRNSTGSPDDNLLVKVGEITNCTKIENSIFRNENDHFCRISDFEPYEEPRMVTTCDIGARVVRGRDWGWGNQDGNKPGTIVKLDSEDGWCYVLWDVEKYKDVYRIGYDNKYDLYYASHPQETPVEQSAQALERPTCAYDNAVCTVTYGDCDHCDRSVLTDEEAKKLESTMESEIEDVMQRDYVPGVACIVHGSRPISTFAEKTWKGPDEKEIERNRRTEEERTRYEKL